MVSFHCIVEEYCRNDKERLMPSYSVDYERAPSLTTFKERSAEVCKIAVKVGVN